jgi:hypothetical protein
MTAQNGPTTGSPDDAESAFPDSRVNRIRGNPNAVVGDLYDYVSNSWLTSWNPSELGRSRQE